ncbi:MAG: V-type ATP synthase subunit C, partial [Clostridia bacterium]|nr:V-type ATP synthase subunit C [Clostridia bacterium]
YQALPAYMQEAAKEAYETLLRTRDGQLCDVIVDKAALEAISAAGKSSKVEIIKNYAESTVAIADIKIAYRCAKTGKSMDFMRRSLAKCGTLNLELLMKAATSGVDAVSDYLSQAGYQEAAEAMKESNSAFERWCDNKMVQTIQPQKYNPFTIGPLIAYVLARENEIKTVRIILTCKQNGLSDDSIRERVREMYV